MTKSNYKHFTKGILSITILMFSCWVKAHEYTPAFLGLVETSLNNFQVTWKIDTQTRLNTRLIPTFPETCKEVGKRIITAQAEAELHHFTMDCLSLNSSLTVEVEGLSGSKTDVLLRISGYQGGEFTQRLTSNSPKVQVPEQLNNNSVISTYTLLGVEHILIGIDHLFFVFALLLLISNVTSLIKTITAFTIAHSITLTASTLGWLTVAIEPVETVIAISILFLALQTAKQQLNNRVKHTPDLAYKYPWLVALSFGLLHGFGFAGALADIGLPEHAIPLALLFFNIGVEIGQLLFIGTIIGLGLIYKKLNLPYLKQWKIVSVYLIGSLSVFWIIQRSAWLVS